MQEFKTFAMRGNVMDMAVGLIVGASFSGIVTALTDNFIQPVLNVVTGAATYTISDLMGFVSIFFAAVFNFILTALVLFCLLKGVNKVTHLSRKKEEDKKTEPTTKKCPYCCSEVPLAAIRCPHCTSYLEEPQAE